VLLELDAVDSFYGDFQALFGISLSVAEGETLAIIGANGAGKSTLLATVAGLLHPASGKVRFGGTALARTPAHRRVSLGISLVPEGRRIFPSLTVEENLRLGLRSGRQGLWSLGRVYELFELLRPLARRSAGVLSGGEQQALAIGRALMANPRLILLDELSMGLAPLVVDALYDAIGRIVKEGMTVVLVEQDVNRALAAADRAYCLLEGRVSLEGSASELTRERIVDAYFGATH
jgi:branched-chain amino acid transport system ATP-binding protein